MKICACCAIFCFLQKQSSENADDIMSGIKITEKHHLRGYVLVNYNLRPY